MGTQIYVFVITLLFWVPLTVLFFRIALPLVRAPFSDPLVSWVYTLTTPVLRPLERYIPRYRNLSLAALLLFWVVAAIEYALLRLSGSLLAWIVGGLAGALSFALGFLIVLLLLYVLFSLFQPRARNSLVFLVERLVAPLCMVFRRRIPPLGPFDLSPAIVMLGLGLLRLVLPGLLYGLAAEL